MFGAATTLVAETVPGGFRPLALGSLQFLAAFGNMAGSLVSLWIQPGAEESLFGLPGWRVLFFVGILPSFLVVPIVSALVFSLYDWTGAARGDFVGLANFRKLLLDQPWQTGSLVTIDGGLSVA